MRGINGLLNTHFTFFYRSRRHVLPTFDELKAYRSHDYSVQLAEKKADRMGIIRIQGRLCSPITCDVPHNPVETFEAEQKHFALTIF